MRGDEDDSLRDEEGMVGGFETGAGAQVKEVKLKRKRSEWEFEEVVTSALPCERRGRRGGC